MRPKIYFITGANTAGKSTLAKMLKKSLPDNFVVYDFDEVGVPAKVDSKWRQKTTKHWIGVGQKNIKQNKSTVVCGLVMPDEVYKISRVAIKIILLDISAKEITKRLKKRFQTAAGLKELKRVTGLTIPECIKANINHSKELRRQCRKYKCKVFNTSVAKSVSTRDKIIKELK